MKPVLIVSYLLVFSLHAFAQKDPPILSAELAKAGDDLLDSGNYKKALSYYDQIDYKMRQIQLCRKTTI